jgi:hypothetical protein
MKLPKVLKDLVNKLGIMYTGDDIIAIKEDPEYANVWMIIIKHTTNQGCNDTDDERFNKLTSHIVFLEREDVMRSDNVGETLVKYFPEILYDLGYSWGARADMHRYKNYTDWAQYRTYDYEYKMA